jgi:uncharacterized protein YjbJ (UPF0337 family)
MNEDQVAGKAEELKGKVKEKIGQAINSPDTENAGVADQVRGGVRQAFGDAKEALKKAVDDNT